MKRKKVLLVTSAYPYGVGETFITAELATLAQYAEVELVPCFYQAGTTPRPAAQTVRLGYAARRWGGLRVVHLLAAFATALRRYGWMKDALHILRHPHKAGNFKELARSLYRARMFEHFLSALMAAEGPFEMVYFYWLIPEILGAIRFRDTAHASLRVVSRAHGGDLYEDRQVGNYIGLRDEITSGVDAIYCISAHGHAYLQGRYAMPPSRLHLARLGVVDPGCLNMQPDGEALSIVSCSFVVREKRLHLVVDAIAWMLAADPRLTVRWTHIGNGALFEDLRDYAARTLGERATVVLAGYMTNSQVVDLYRTERFDVIVNVSDYEGIPVSLMEASAAGIPMVATDVGGNGEIVNAGNGVLIPADSDGAAIGATLLRFRDRPVAAAYRKAARAGWEQHFNADANYHRFGRALTQVLG